MLFFIDTANIEEIREAHSWGVVAGVTTNPSLIAREGRNFREVVDEICAIVDGPISAEVISLDAPGMIREAEGISGWHPNIVIKIPMTPEGLKATAALAAKGINTNVTLIFSPAQALLAARAGAAYVSPFIGRLEDVSTPGMDLIADIAEIFAIHSIDSQIIAASIRSPIHVMAAARAGAQIATVPFRVLQQMCNHPLTDRGIEGFLADWAQVPK
ncbi:MAG: fructose-6-phosphate aldolase [Limnochordia bacterium]